MNSIFQSVQDILTKIGVFFRGLWQKARHTIGQYTSQPEPDEEEAPVKDVRTTARIAVHKPAKSKPIHRHGRQKVYRLKGYTTVAKVNRKRQSERRQRQLRHVLLVIILVLAVIMLFNFYNPIKNIAEFYRAIGIQGLSDLISGTTAATTTIETTPEETSTTGESETTTTAAATSTGG
jgi:hypothetical protein